MKTKLVFAVLISVALISSGAALAGEKETSPKLKSAGVALLLGLDPIPGDALWYAGKRGQAFGAFIMSVPAYIFLVGASTCDSKDWGCLGWAFIGMGAIPLYAAAYLWDVIGGVHGVNKHNELVRKQQTSIWNRVQPSLAVTQESAFGGVRVTF